MPAQKPLNRCLSAWFVTSRDSQLSAVQKQMFSVRRCRLHGLGYLNMFQCDEFAYSFRESRVTGVFDVVHSAVRARLITDRVHSAR
jgi:hypothetical protein